MDDESYRILQQVCSSNPAEEHSMEEKNKTSSTTTTLPQVLVIPPSLDWLPPRPQVFPQCNFDCCSPKEKKNQQQQLQQQQKTQHSRDKKSPLQNDDDDAISVTSVSTTDSETGRHDEDPLQATPTPRVMKMAQQPQQQQQQPQQQPSLWSRCWFGRKSSETVEWKGNDTRTTSGQCQQSRDDLDNAVVDNVAEASDGTCVCEDLDTSSQNDDDDNENDDDETATHPASMMQQQQQASMMHAMTHHPLRNASHLFLGVFQLLLSMWIADTAIHAMLHKNNNKKKQM